MRSMFVSIEITTVASHLVSACRPVFLTLRWSVSLLSAVVAARQQATSWPPRGDSICGLQLWVIPKAFGSDCLVRGASPASGGQEPALAAERGIRACLRATPAERPELCRFALRLLMRLLPVCVPPESCGLGRPPCTRARVLPVWESPTSQEPRGPQPQTGCAHGAPGLHRALLPCILGPRLGEQTGHLQVGTGCPQASRSM